MRRLDDFEKALLVLWISSQCDLSQIESLSEMTKSDAQIAVIAALCFDGDVKRATIALQDCAERGLAEKS